ncbi:MAG: class I SAM-dependent methyltransferase [Planctomycetota bacterium]|nr:class I SAM-dependent methyltransferase [Planctomycetota bacterium]MDA1213937.1 class I SAM-dependent methyltransferase [Planctomycetota bacterium]
MSLNDRERWDQKYSDRMVPDLVMADEWLMDHAAKSNRGRAIDLACGLGHNAIWLAQQGWQVDAVDISPVGLSIAKKFAMIQSTDVNFICADLEGLFLVYHQQMETSYDLVSVFRFLDREHLPEIIPRLLKPGGLLIYETFSRKQLDRDDSHIKDARFTLSPGELPRLYSSLSVVAHEEVDLSDRCVDRLLARRES